MPITQLWFAMFITGLGIGPTLSVYTIIVQNAVPFPKLGVATSNLTFFRQIGGSVGLAIAGTVFANALASELPKQVGTVVATNVPQAQQPQVAQALAEAFATIDLNNLTGVGQSFGAAVAAVVPALAPLVSELDTAFFNAFTYGVSQTFLIGVVAGAAALVASLAMKELPLRTDDRRGAGRTCRQRFPARRARGSDATPSQASSGHVGAMHTGRIAEPSDGPGAIRVGAVRFPRMPATAAPFRPGLRAPGTQHAPFEAVLAVDELPPGSLRRVSRGDLDVLLAHTPIGIVAVDDRCPHMSAPLSIGRLEGCVVMCPLHNGRFDLASGDPVQMPTTGGLDPDGVYHPTWSPPGAESEARAARQEGRGAPADARPPVPLLPGPDRRRPDRGRAAEQRVAAPASDAELCHLHGVHVPAPQCAGFESFRTSRARFSANRASRRQLPARPVQGFGRFTVQTASYIHGVHTERLEGQFVCIGCKRRGGDLPRRLSFGTTCRAGSASPRRGLDRTRKRAAAPRRGRRSA